MYITTLCQECLDISNSLKESASEDVWDVDEEDTETTEISLSTCINHSSHMERSFSLLSNPSYRSS